MPLLHRTLGNLKWENISEGFFVDCKTLYNVQMLRHHCCCFIAARKAGGANLPGDSLLCALYSWYVFCTPKYISKQHTIILVFLVILFKYNFLICPHPRGTAAQLQGVPFNCSGFVSSHSIPPRGARLWNPMLQQCSQPAEMVNPENLTILSSFSIFININSNAACFGQFFTFFFFCFTLDSRTRCVFLFYWIKMEIRGTKHVTFKLSRTGVESVCQDLTHFFYKGPDDDYVQFVAYGVPASTT